MRQPTSFNYGTTDDMDSAKEIASTIMTYLKGNINVTQQQNENTTTFNISERLLRFFSWGANKYQYIKSTDNCFGLQFNVSGLLFKGRIRIWYTPADLFDVEYLYVTKNIEKLKPDSDVFFDDLGNFIHNKIEDKNAQPL